MALVLFLLGMVVAAAAGSSTLIVLLVRGVQKVRASRGERFDAVCDLIVSLLVWGALSAIMLILLALMSWGVMHGGTDRPLGLAGYGMAGIVVLLYVGYAAAGWGLSKWALRGGEAQAGALASEQPDINFEVQH